LHHLRRVTAIAFLLSGVLELLFAGFSVFGTVLGAFMSGTGGPAAELGPLLFWLYLVIGIAAFGGAAVHLYASIRMLTGNPPNSVIWVATVGSIVPLVTVYCALPSLVAGMLGLVLLLLPEKEPEPA
jgi:hypothetical protein